MPSESEIIIPDKPVASPSNSSSTIVPQPSIVEPSREKPRNVVALEEIIKPASPAIPPPADKIVAPSKSIWNPATGVELLNKTDPLDVT